MKAGDVVRHLRTFERLRVESVEKRCVFVAWFDACGEIHRKCYLVDFLVPEGMALA